MTKEKVEKLEIDVAVIKNSILTLKDDTKSVKSLLKWFIVLVSGLVILVIGTLVNSSGEKRIMQETLKHNSVVIGEMAAQAIEQGLYKPTKEAYRTGNDTSN